MKRSILVTILSLSFFAAPVAENKFEFVAIGDMPYGKKEVVYGPYEALISEINRQRPTFTIHIGDIKSEKSYCSNLWLDEAKRFFNTFKSALIYTPGDNEWTDCYRKEAGSFNPLDRLNYIRSTFFAKPDQSLGINPINVESQASGGYPENVRFVQNNVMIVTAHVVGSNNNFLVRDLTAVQEFFKRDKANVEWLKASFKDATTRICAGLVLAIHANMLDSGFEVAAKKETFQFRSGFKIFGEVFIKLAADFDKPVLLIYGDTHKYRIGRPFPKGAPNVISLEVFGSKQMHGVKVIVDPKSKAFFSFQPIMNPVL